MGLCCSRCREREPEDLLNFDDESDEEAQAILFNKDQLSQSEPSISSERTSSLHSADTVDVTFHHYNDLCDEELARWEFAKDHDSDDEIEELESKRASSETIKFVSPLCEADQLMTDQT